MLPMYIGSGSYVAVTGGKFCFFTANILTHIDDGSVLFKCPIIVTNESMTISEYKQYQNTETEVK